MSKMFSQFMMKEKRVLASTVTAVDNHLINNTVLLTNADVLQLFQFHNCLLSGMFWRFAREPLMYTHH